MLRNQVSLFGTHLVGLLLLGALPAASSAQVRVTEVGTLKPPINVEQMVYDAPHQLLIARNSASTVAVIKLADGSSTLHQSTYQFTDLSLSPQGGVLYAADYGGEQIGYGTPAKQNYVHRLDLATGSWSVQKATLAGNVQTVDDQTFVLKSNDQWVTFTYNAWGTGTAIKQLNSNTNSSFPGYYASVYGGNFVYAAGSGRLIHGNAGVSSQELQAFRLVENDFAKQEGSGTYGSAQGFGGSLCLSTDASSVYYGQLRLDALDVTHKLGTFAAAIYAATPRVAFARDDYYDVRTGDQVDSLAFPTTVYALDRAGAELWAYDAASTTLHHYAITVDGTTPDPVTPGTVADAGVPATKEDASIPSADDGSVPTTKEDASIPSAADAGAVVQLDAGLPGSVNASGDARVVFADSGNAAADDDAGSVGDDASAGDSGGDDDGCSLAGRSNACASAVALALLLMRRRRRAGAIRTSA